MILDEVCKGYGETKMEEHERIDINPTWELIDFNKATDMIPKKMKDYLTYRGLNPLDESVAVCFNIYDGIYVYYLPSTNEIQVSNQYYLH